MNCYRASYGEPDLLPCVSGLSRQCIYNSDSNSPIILWWERSCITTGCLFVLLQCWGYIVTVHCSGLVSIIHVTDWYFYTFIIPVNIHSGELIWFDPYRNRLVGIKHLYHKAYCNCWFHIVSNCIRLSIWSKFSNSKQTSFLKFGLLKSTNSVCLVLA